MAGDDSIKVIGCYNKTNNPERKAYKNLASAIIHSAIKEHDMLFFKREWCKTLCFIADIDYNALCEKMGVK